jgi:hypothetical protein
MFARRVPWTPSTPSAPRIVECHRIDLADVDGQARRLGLAAEVRRL